MSRILALDTASPWGGVALVERASHDVVPVTLAEAGFHARDHGRHLIGWIDALLDRAGVPRDGLDGFVATRGPGSFTGLRVGLGTIRGLAVAAGRPCRGIGTLVAMAEAFGPAETLRVPLLIAGRGEVYGAAFDAASSPPVERAAPRVGPPAEVVSALAGSGGAVAFGPGTALAADDLARRNCRMASAPRGVAAAAGRLVLIAEPDEDSLTPVYLRPPDALLGT